MDIANNLRKLSRRKRRRHAHSQPGSAPGTLFAPPDSPPTKVRVMAYGPGECVQVEADRVQDVEAMRGEHPVLWVDVTGLGNLDVIRRIGKVFGLHLLAMEDVVHTYQRPKIDSYDGFDLIITRMTRQVNGGLDVEQVAIVLGDGFVLTFQEREGDCLGPVRERIRQRTGRIRDAGADYLAYAIVDAIVDHYFPILEAYGDRLDDLERQIVEEPEQAVAASLLNIRRELLAMRRAVWPLRDALVAVRRDESPRFAPETHIFVRDLEDHILQLVELFENFRETGASLMDLYTTMMGHRMNEVMKVLTVIATIFIPLTFIAGIYGMNFDPDVSPWNMPELGWAFGYPFSLGLMAAMAVGMVIFFRKKRWF